MRVLKYLLGAIGLGIAALTLIAAYQGPSQKPGTRPPWVSAKLYPFKDHWINIDGNMVHYLDEGRGPTLLLLHGNPSWSFEHRYLIEQLAGLYRCISLDYPGFGLSTARPGYSFLPSEHSEIVEKLALALNLKGITLVMEDWGGPIGLGFAGRRPELIRSLVIGNTWAWPVNGDPQFEKFSNFMGGPIGSFLNRYFDIMVNVGIPTNTERSLSQEVMSQYRGPFPTYSSRSASTILAKSIIGDRDHPAEVQRNLNKIADRPALILWPLKDRAFKAKEREHFEMLFKHHKTVLLPNAKHYIQEDAPDRIAAEIKDFVRY